MAYGVDQDVGDHGVWVGMLQGNIDPRKARKITKQHEVRIGGRSPKNTVMKQGQKTTRKSGI